MANYLSNFCILDLFINFIDIEFNLLARLIY